MLEILKALIFGIVEGITEWLPISSTGHIILLNEFMPLDVSQEFMDVFEVVIQLGAILAVVLIFWKKIFSVSKGKGRHKNGYEDHEYVVQDRCGLCASRRCRTFA